VATAGRTSGLVIQALRYLGKDHVDDAVVDTLAQRLSQDDQLKTASGVFSKKDSRPFFRHDYFGMGSTMAAFSGKVASPDLPLMRYWTFNCFTVPDAGSPPKLVL